jgi:hypothetical protein
LFLTFYAKKDREGFQAETRFWGASQSGTQLLKPPNENNVRETLRQCVYKEKETFNIRNYHKSQIHWGRRRRREETRGRSEW